MEQSNIQFHITRNGENAKWNADEKRVEIGANGVGDNGPEYLGAFPHELEHGYQFISGQLAGYIGMTSDPLYDLSDEYNAAWRGTLLGEPKDFSRWHSTSEGLTYDQYKMTETTPQSGHLALRNKTTAISVGTSATVLVGTNNLLAPSASQVLRNNPNATVEDAINYYNSYKEKTGSPNRILIGKALENRN